VIAAIAMAALTAVIESARTGWWRGFWRPVTAVLVAPLGLLAFWGFVAIELRRHGGWFGDEKSVGMSFDWGASTLRIVHATFLEWPKPYTMLTVLLLVAALGLAAWSLTERIPAHLHAYTLVVVMLAVMTNAHYLGSKPRFLLPAFLLALPLARILAPVRNRVLVPLIAILAVASTWFGLFLASVGWAP
jgi:hypothetical protein